MAFGAYEGALRELIHVLKYRRIKSAAPRLAKLLDRALVEFDGGQPLLVVPIPLWPGKRRDRGFNQAEEIARAFCRLRAPKSIQLSTALLVRARETASQTGLTLRQRRANLRGAFAVVRPELVKGRNVLLIDDVMTTGATVGECARVLLRAGARHVDVATVARATRETSVAPGLAISARATSSLASLGTVDSGLKEHSGGLPGHA